MEKLRADLADASIQQYGKAEERSVLIRLPQLGREGDYAGQTVAKLLKDLNPESADPNKLDINFTAATASPTSSSPPIPIARGRTTREEVLLRHGAEHHQQALGARPLHEHEPGQLRAGRDRADRRRAQSSTFLGAFNVLNQETVGPQVGRELQQKAIWAVILSTLAMGATSGCAST
jgi:preprotein translocase subunit SecF